MSPLSITYDFEELTPLMTIEGERLPVDLSLMVDGRAEIQTDGWGGWSIIGIDIAWTRKNARSTPDYITLAKPSQLYSWIERALESRTHLDRIDAQIEREEEKNRDFENIFGRVA